MKANRIVLAAIVLMACAWPATGSAQTVQCSNGHTYELVQNIGAISWDAANTAAQNHAANLQGKHSYLATLEEDGEHECLDTALQGFVGPAWLGGFQSQDAIERSAGWRWVNGDGPISGNDENWAEGHPDEILDENDFSGAFTDLDFIALQGGHWYSAHYSGVPLGQYSHTGAISAYVVEIETTPEQPPEEVGIIIEPADCQPQNNADGCQTVDEQHLILPESTEIEDGAVILFRAWTFRDPRVNDAGKCDGGEPDGNGNNFGRQPLDVFAHLLPDDEELHGTFILQEYLCGSPYFKVVRTEAPGVHVPSGTVRIRHELMAENEPFECAPIAGPGVADAQFRDTVVWQSTRHPGLEEGFDSHYNNVPRDWEGSASERTTLCGSSEGDAEGLSYYGIGLHIDFGLDPANASGTGEQVTDEFVLLVKYKLLLLRDAVDNAENVLDEDDYEKLRKEAEKAYEELMKGHYQHTINKLDKFLDKVDDATFAYSSEKNYEGELIARALNARFTLADKIIPFL